MHFLCKSWGLAKYYSIFKDIWKSFFLMALKWVKSCKSAEILALITLILNCVCKLLCSILAFRSHMFHLDMFTLIHHDFCTLRICVPLFTQIEIVIWDWDSMNWNILYQLILLSTSLFTDKLELLTSWCFIPVFPTSDTMFYPCVYVCVNRYTNA